MSDHFAYSFKTDLTLPAMFSRLQQVGPWRWLERDSDRWDAYISATPVSESHREKAIVKIFVEDGFYVVDILLRSDHPEPRTKYEGVLQTLSQSLLPAIGAREINSADPRE